LVTKLASGRHLQYVKDMGMLAIKISNGQKEQEFYFDGKTKTIRCQAYKTLALSVTSSGNGARVNIAGSSSATHQLWKLEGDRFVSLHRRYNLEVAGNKD